MCRIALPLTSAGLVDAGRGGLRDSGLLKTKPKYFLVLSSKTNVVLVKCGTYIYFAPIK